MEKVFLPEEYAGVLVWDEEYGEGDVELLERFMEEPAITQLDAMKDWIDALTRIYNETLKDYETKH
jgi:hypothetical protein